MTVSLIKFHFIIYTIRQIFSLTTPVVSGVQDFGADLSDAKTYLDWRNKFLAELITGHPYSR